MLTFQVCVNMLNFVALRKSVVGVYETRMGAISSVRQIVYKWRKCNRSITPRSGYPTRAKLTIFWEITKTPENSKASTGRSCTEQCTDVSVHDSTIRNIPKKNDLNERLLRRKPLVSKKHNATSFKFAKDDPAGY